MITDTSLDTHLFGASLIEGTTQIYEAIKPSASPTWGSPNILSDPSVSVTSFDVKRDSANNLVLGWIGENTVLSDYCMYARVYFAGTDEWSTIHTVSSETDNLVGNFALAINTFNAEIVWTVFNEFFDIENKSASISLEIGL